MQALTSYGRLDHPREETVGLVRREKKSGYRCVDIFRNRSRQPIRRVCFEAGSPVLVIEHYFPSDRTYEYSDYRPVGSKYFPGNGRSIVRRPGL